MWLSHLTLTHEKHGLNVHERHAVWCPSRITLKTHYVQLQYKLDHWKARLIGIEHNQIEGSKHKMQLSKFIDHRRSIFTQGWVERVYKPTLSTIFFLLLLPETHLVLFDPKNILQSFSIFPQVWKCEFCDKENPITPEMQNFPEEADVTYTIHPGSVDGDDTTVIFMVDISGSMSVTTEVCYFKRLGFMVSD